MSATGSPLWVARLAYLNKPAPYVVGSLLIFAGSLKIHQVLTEPQFPPDGFAMARFYVVMACEIICGWALLLRFRPHFSRLAALVLFSIFLAVSAFHLTDGAKSCGCLGKLDLGPLAMVAVDLVVLAALWHWRPDHIKPSDRMVPSWGILLLPLSIVPVLGWLGSSSPFPHLIVTPEVSDFENLPQGAQRAFTFRLYNPHEHPVAIQEIETSCPCLAVRRSMAVVEPGREASVEVHLDLGHEPTFTGQLLIEIAGKTPTGTTAFVARVRVRVVECQ
jgi:uncharacterized membrane protein YphA (DoxX/SURF4 family)